MFNLDRFRRRDNHVKDHEIVPGVDKPTLILVTMVVAKMLKEPKNSTYKLQGLSEEAYRYQTEDASLQASYIAVAKTKRIGCENVNVGYVMRDHIVKCGSQEFRLIDKKEQKILEEGFRKALELKVKFEEQEAENARQDAALAAIDKFFKVKPEPKKPKELLPSAVGEVQALRPV